MLKRTIFVIVLLLVSHSNLYSRLTILDAYNLLLQQAKFCTKNNLTTYACKKTLKMLEDYMDIIVELAAKEKGSQSAYNLAAKLVDQLK
jgi:hypothetical protein